MNNTREGTVFRRWSVGSGQWAVDSGQWTEGRIEEEREGVGEWVLA
jgi:hypothetical protein